MSLTLYYDSKKGLVKGKNYSVGNSITEHDERGLETPLHEQILKIPGRNVEIVVRTKLHCGSKSFMNARISLMGKSVLNFFDTSLRHSIEIVYAGPGNWDMLFDGIIQLYNAIYNCENSINAYFDALENRVCEFTGNIGDVFDRIAELANKLPDSIYSDNVIIDKRMKRVCGLLFQKIVKKWDGMPMTDSVHQKIESNLQSIFKYLSEHDGILDSFTMRP